YGVASALSASTHGPLGRGSPTDGYLDRLGGLLSSAAYGDLSLPRASRAARAGNWLWTGGVAGGVATCGGGWGGVLVRDDPACQATVSPALFCAGRCPCDGPGAGV